MSKRLLLTLGIICTLAASAQKSEEYPVKAGEIPDKVLPNKAKYILPAFTQGTAMFRNKTSNTRLFNYSFLLNEMHFISDNGDTLAIAEPTLLDYVRIDTLYFYYDNGYVQQIANHGDFKFAAKREIVQVLDKKKSAYNISTGSSSIDSYQSVVADNSQLFKLEVGKDMLFKKVTSFYIGDKYNHFVKATKKGFNSVFGSQKVSTYLKSHKVNFNIEDDIKGLFDYCTM